jgi:hypothetical protein
VYAARSTEDTRGSIPEQLRDCRAAIELDSGREVVGEYTDEAFSAYSGNPDPGLVDAMNLVEDQASRGLVAPRMRQHESMVV